MRDNRPFTEEQDEIIRKLYEKENIKKWSVIASFLTDKHNFPRNAKQCRDRYQQHLDPLMVSQWTYEQQQKLYNIHDQIGNKWAVIAQKFQGRTDNCVKNHFYSKLRKSLRHLNKVIKQKFKKDFKQMKIGAIYKIIQALEDRFNQNTMIQQEVFSKCIRLKRQLLQYANVETQLEQGDFTKQKQLIRQIIDFSRNYKRKTKKQRRSSLNGAQLFKPATLQKRIKYSSDQQSSQSSYQMVLSHRQQSQNQSPQSEIQLGVIQEDIRQSMTSKYEPNIRLTQKQQFDDQIIRNSLKVSNRSCLQLNSVQQILRQKNVLQEGVNYQNKLQQSLCSLSIRSQSEKQDMFDDNLRISEKIRNIQQMQEQSPQQNIFRSHR